MSGATIRNGRLLTWGDGLDEWTLPELKRRRLAPGDFRVGCEFDGAIAVQDGDELVWIGDGRRERIDTHAAVIDASAAVLFGRKGVLVSHHGMQVRFYERVGTAWTYREIYSFYTASEQGGFLVRDIDGNGRADIVCGNYWIQSPTGFDLPWRLFAINLFHEEPLSASARLVWWRGRLLWIASKQPNARAVLFTPPGDVRQLWTPEPVAFDPPLAFPRAILARDDEVWIGEDNGAASRVIAFPSMRVVRRGLPVHTLLAWNGRVVAVGPSGPAILP